MPEVTEVTVVDSALDLAELDAVAKVRRRFAAYVVAGAAAPPWFKVPKPARQRGRPRLRFAPGLGARADVSRYAGRVEQHALDNGLDLRSVSASYLRATYAGSGEPLVEGAEQLLDSNGIAKLAHDLFDVEYVVPFTVYANVYLPGQLLHEHTDVPAFRGAERGQVPSWLLVAMHHSGLFEHWRVPVATVVIYPRARATGGELTWFERPEGGDEAASLITTFAPTDNSAVVFDGDTVFHRVEPVEGPVRGLDELSRGAYVVPTADGWELRRDVAGTEASFEPLETYGADDVRYSVSWKAHCFGDIESWQIWHDHADDLDLDGVVPALTALLCEKGALPGPDHGLDEEELAAVMIDELIPFPPPGTKKPPPGTQKR